MSTSKNMNPSSRSLASANNFISLASEMNGQLCKGSKILDFGCGAGSLVEGFLREEYDAYGCDITFKEGESTAALLNCGRLKKMDLANYSIPFEDNSFDLVVSNQVFEHVQNYNEAFGEIARVLRPSGISIHVFPARWRVIEPHTFIPFATVFRPEWYLRTWQYVVKKRVVAGGIVGNSDANVARKYLLERTNYLTKKQLVSAMSASFSSSGFCELAALKFSARRSLHKFLSHVPFAQEVISELMARVIYCRK